MAWVEKLPSGRYRAVYRDVDGKRKSLGVFTHKRAAQDAGGDKEAELRRGVGKRPEMTWGEWREQWWANRAVEESTLKRESTMRVKHMAKRRRRAPRFYSAGGSTSSSTSSAGSMMSVIS